MTGKNTELVDRVVRTVDTQTSKKQPDRVPAHKIVLILGRHGNENPDRVREALDQAVNEGKIERDEEHVWVPA